MSNTQNDQIIEYAQELVCHCSDRDMHCLKGISSMKCKYCGKPPLSIYLNNLQEV
jgi:hypothetical protein